MDLKEAQTLIVAEMDKHGLISDGWSFEWDRATQRFGSCRYATRRITLSATLVQMNSWKTVRNTTLHEIAHALAGHAAGHGPAWKRVARRIGGDAERTYSDTKVATPADKLVGTCPGCGKHSFRNRRPSRPIACAACCRKHNRGRYDARFLFTWALNTEGLRK